MLSYQHIYHAGNFADVQKHAALVRLLQILARKPQKFCVMDTHAGRGLYDLAGAEAQKTGEFKNGVLPFWNARRDDTPLSPYLRIVEAFNGGGNLGVYPGSAAIARALMRPSDRLILTERHPGEYAALQKCLEGALNVSLEQEDGFRHLVDRVPFAERRGLVLVDPSYEIKAEYAELPKQLQQAYKKWPQGQFMVWYPMLGAGLHRRMLTALRQSAIKDMLVSEITLDPPPEEEFGLHGSGLVIINPPSGFEAELNELTRFIAGHVPMKAAGRVFWLDNRKIDPDTGMLAV